eukprot:PhM_4_TR17627/c0_g1_i1/m.52722
MLGNILVKSKQLRLFILGCSLSSMYFSQSKNDQCYDTIIIGGDAAGLSAVAALRDHNQRCLLLDARDDVTYERRVQTLLDVSELESGLAQPLHNHAVTQGMRAAVAEISKAHAQNADDDATEKEHDALRRADISVLKALECGAVGGKKSLPPMFEKSLALLSGGTNLNDVGALMWCAVELGHDATPRDFLQRGAALVTRQIEEGRRAAASWLPTAGDMTMPMAKPSLRVALGRKVTGVEVVPTIATEYPVQVSTTSQTNPGADAERKNYYAKRVLVATRSVVEGKPKDFYDPPVPVTPEQRKDVLKKRFLSPAGYTVTSHDLSSVRCEDAPQTFFLQEKDMFVEAGTKQICKKMESRADTVMCFGEAIGHNKNNKNGHVVLSASETSAMLLPPAVGTTSRDARWFLSKPIDDVAGVSRVFFATDAAFGAAYGAVCGQAVCGVVEAENIVAQQSGGSGKK